MPAQRAGPVVAGLIGGLGNQLFQYAAARALALRLGVPLKLDISWYAGRTTRWFGLDAFAIAADITPLPLPPLPAIAIKLKTRLARRLLPRRHGLPIFRERSHRFDPAFAAIPGPVYLEGYWQSERYFAAIAPQLRQELSFIARPSGPAVDAILGCIAATDAIAVHVRRGDYVANPVAAKTYAACSPDYYRLAIAVVAKGLPNPHCFVFSDDPAWARANLHTGFPTTVVESAGEADAVRDLFLMSACAHFVIANSTFSWWAAWLGRSPEKLVVAPAAWFIDPALDASDIVPIAWLRL